MINEWEVWFTDYMLKLCPKKPMKQPYDDWFVCMREAFKAGYFSSKENYDSNWGSDWVDDGC